MAAGRPKTKPETQLTITLKVMLTKDQEAAIRRFAGGNMSGWARMVLLNEVRRLEAIERKGK